MAERERDPVTGRLTTGHNWDGIRELNTPIPGWWVSMALICVGIAMIYMLLYPSVPSLSGYTPGWLGWSSEAALREEQRAAREAQASWRHRMASLTPEQIAADPELRRIALIGGRAAFGQNCAGCHGPEAGGQVGQFPALVDDDWIWGGTLDDIFTTIRHGIRNADPETRQSAMPSFAETLTAQQVTDVAVFVRTLSDPTAATTRDALPGAAVFAENCAACHGAAGEGGRGQGAPRLNDRIWLYGGTVDAIRAQILHPRMGVMPAWQGRLDPETIRMLAVFIHSLGGGEE